MLIDIAYFSQTKYGSILMWFNDENIIKVHFTYIL
jgi:hypothetical protein